MSNYAEAQQGPPAGATDSANLVNRLEKAAMGLKDAQPSFSQTLENRIAHHEEQIALLSALRETYLSASPVAQKALEQGYRQGYRYY